MLLRLAALAMLVVTACSAAETLRIEARGFGAVEAVATAYGEGAGRSSWTRFRCEDAAHARVCAAKRLADLAGFGGIAAVAAPGLPGTVVAADGIGAWLLGLRGAEFHELFAPDVAGLKAVVAAAAAADLQAVVAKAYPRWLDCFDNAGPGVWVGGGGDDYEVPRDFAWLQERRLTMCTMAATESRLVAPGVVDTAINDWHAAMAARYDLPYRTLLFPNRPAWAWNRVPLPYVVPAPGFLAYPFKDHQADSIQSSYEPNAATDPWLHDLRRRLAERLGADPNFIGNHGCTEIPNAGILELATVAGMPEVLALWRSYLSGQLGLDLPRVSERHTGDPARYRSWDEVRVPLPEDFAAWDPATCLDLRGTWEMRPDPEDQGRKGEWFRPGAAGEWTRAPHNDALIMALFRGRMNFMNDVKVPFWMRREVAVAPERLGGLRYLHIARNAGHGNLPAAPDVWVNGRPLKRLTDDVRGQFGNCYELGDALRGGANTVAMDSHGHPIPGYIFLGPEPLRVYPRMDRAHNRLWYDMVGFSAWLRLRAVEDNLRAQRSADPDRPLKLMALINLLDLARPLAERYGAYFHDTGGAAAFWAPMTGSRLSRTHGLPWSCEQGSPPNNVAEMQKGLTMYLMLGNDAVDLVFGVGHYSRKPEIAGWIDRNLDLVHCIGKMRLPLPPVGILRATRTTRLGFGDPWNWDIGRGELQAVGRNFAYCEPGDLGDGSADRFTVVFDCATVLMTDEDVAGIERYVRQGGIFIAQHHTGRHSPDQADAWPFARLSGVKVSSRGEGKGGRMRFTDTQTLWPQLRGREVKGWGMAMNWQGADISGAPVGLTPASGDVEAVAQWQDLQPGQGPVAIAARRIGKGMVITLGSTFWREVKDAGGAYRSGGGAQEVLDELLTSLGVPRDSWTGDRDVWAECWQSKNGVFDLYPVARMHETANPAEVAVSLRRAAPVSRMTLIGEGGSSQVAVAWKDGRVALPAAVYGPMQTRIFLAPRADRERAGLEWLRVQGEHWRALPPVPADGRPAVVAVPEDVLPLADGWRLAPTDAPAGWLEADDAAWKPVRLGAFASMGLPEDAVARLRRTIAVPPAWKGRRISLVFNAENWFWGLLPQGRLWVDGRPAALPQPIMPAPAPGFSLDVTVPASGTLVLALEIDGGRGDRTQVQRRPHGALGMFLLQATPVPLRSDPLPAPWQAATAYNALRPHDGTAPYIYLQTAFTLPQAWPAKRLFLEADGALGYLVLNGVLLSPPRSLDRLDISGLVRRDGPNTLCWMPSPPEERIVTRTDPAPAMRLAWQP